MTVTVARSQREPGERHGSTLTSSDSDESSWHGKLELVLLGEKGDDLAPDRLAVDLALGILRHDSGTDLDLLSELQSSDQRSVRKVEERNGRRTVTHPEDSLQQRSTSNTTLQILHLSSGLVDIERTNNDELRGSGKVANGNGDLGDDVLDESVDVVPQLSRNGDDGCRVGHGALDEIEDRLLVLVGLLFADQIDLVLWGNVESAQGLGLRGRTYLENEDVLQLHDLNSGQVLRSLGLRARLVGGDKEKSSVHDGGSVQHSSHENVVTRAIDKGDVTVVEGERSALAFSTSKRRRTHRRRVMVPPHLGTSHGG